MDIMLFISRFLYRIRYRLLWGTFFVTGLVIYFTQFLPYSYTVKSSLYAGITNSTNLDGSPINFGSVNATFDNLINIAKSRKTLEQVSLRLLANSLTHGEEWNDNTNIRAKHYRQLLQVTPKEVLALVDRSNEVNTLARLTDYANKSNSNFIYTTFNQDFRFYSAKALEELAIKRINNSDILEITYTSADPGITQKTVEYVIEELKKAYEIVRFKSTHDVIDYFEGEVKRTKSILNSEEDDLMNYNVQERVINYDEETKALAGTRYSVDDRVEEAQRTYDAAVSLREMLDERMDVRAQMIKNNTNLLEELNRVSTLNQSIMEQEIFVSDKHHADNARLQRDKEALKQSENNISQISDRLNSMAYTKEGVGIEEMIAEWLAALVNEAKAKAELKVLKSRQEDIVSQYIQMAPVGTQVNRKERAISIAEDNYRIQLKGLADANMRLKNIEMSTSNLQTVAPPDYPLTDNGRKRALYVIAAFLGSLLFIITYFLLIELLDHTLRDPFRSKRLTGLEVLGAFNGVSNLQFRGFLKACNRIATAYACRRMQKYIKSGETTVINLLSIHPGEGKTFLSDYFRRYWQQTGVNVRIVTPGEDYLPTDKEYIQAHRLNDFWNYNEAEQKADILLVEYPPMLEASIPVDALKEADANLLIANAARLWGQSDDGVLTPLRNELADTPLLLYLNNADRDVVESFTGELPPHTYLHTFFSRLSQFGLTSKKNAVK